MDRLLFRVDGSEDIGMGHIFRTITLAKEIRKIEPKTFIVFSINENRFAEDYLASNGFKTIVIFDKFSKTEEITQIVDIVKNYSINKIIVDKFDIDTEYIKELKTIDISVIQFFYDNPSSIIADIGINPNIGSSADISISSGGCQLLVGSKYILVREKYRNENIRVDDNIKNIVISFGAGDKNNITTKIIEFIDEYYNIRSLIELPVLNIVIGPVYSNVEQIIEKVRKSKLKIKLIFNYTDLSSIMKESDFAISSVGGTVYELLSLKVPILGILQSKDQEQVAKYLDENKCIINLGYIEQLNSHDFFSTLDRIYFREERQNILKAASKLIDGKGAERCARQILNLNVD